MAFLLGVSSKPVSRCRALICLLAFKQILFTCSSNVEFTSMQIPRVVIDFENSICWPWIITLKSLACLLPFSNKPWNLAGFASIALSANHCIVTSAQIGIRAWHVMKPSRLAWVATSNQASVYSHRLSLCKLGTSSGGNYRVTTLTHYRFCWDKASYLLHGQYETFKWVAKVWVSICVRV